MLDGLSRSEHAATGRDAADLLAAYEFDVLLVDADLPDMAAAAFLRDIRAGGDMTPALVLNGINKPLATARLLDAGADDVVLLPCDPSLIAARLRALVRRAHGHGSSLLAVGGATLCLARHELHVFGAPVHLTPREFSLLEALFLKRGGILDRERLLIRLYGPECDTETKAVDVLVCRLRKKLAMAGAPGLVETMVGGYALGNCAAAPVGSLHAETGWRETA